METATRGSFTKGCHVEVGCAATLEMEGTKAIGSTGGMMGME